MYAYNYFGMALKSTGIRFNISTAVFVINA